MLNTQTLESGLYIVPNNRGKQFFKPLPRLERRKALIALANFSDQHVLFFSLGALRAPANKNWTMHQQQKVIKLSITFPLACRKNKERLQITSEHNTTNQWINLDVQITTHCLDKSEYIAMSVQ